MKSIYISFVLINLVPIFESCISNFPDDCRCPPLTYYDFNSVRIDGAADGESTIILEMNLEGVSFLSIRDQNGYAGSSLFACSCLLPGSRGLKNQISNIEITSDTDFGLSLPAGSDLSSMNWEFEDPLLGSKEDLIQNMNRDSWRYPVVMVLKLDEDNIPKESFKLKLSLIRDDESIIEDDTTEMSF